DRLLKPGMNSEVSVSISHRANVLTVPNEAVASVRDAASAGAALGLNEDDLREKMTQMRPARSGGQGGRQGGGSAGGGSWRGRGQGGSSGGAGGGRSGGFGGGQGGGWTGRAGQGGSGASGDVHPGVIFVKGAKGPEPKFVMLGLSDWDYTEVIRGLEPNTEVYLISV